MNKLLAAFVVGFMIIGLGGPISIVSAQCVPEAPPAPSFNPPAGTYGYSLDMTDPMAPEPILQAVVIESSATANVIFYTLDGSAPVAWDPTDPTDPNYNMDGLATLTGSIPYMDLTSTAGVDLTAFTAVGTLYFMGLAAEPYVPGPATVTIKAIEIETTLGQTSPIAEATYTIDPTLWAGDYTVVGDVEFFTLAQGLLASTAVGGAGFTAIDGVLTITEVLTPDPLGFLYGCYNPMMLGCLANITGNLIIENNPNTTTANIVAMETDGRVTIGAVNHCSNADDDPCPENTLTINLCEKSVDCGANPPEWACDVDAEEATVAYTPVGPTLDVQVTGTVPGTSMPYTLVYYPDPWPGTGLICLGSATSDGSGAITIPWTKNAIGQDLPISGDTNAPEAKLMLVPSANVICGSGSQISGWPCSSIMFEATLDNDLITYTYTP